MMRRERDGERAGLANAKDVHNLCMVNNHGFSHELRNSTAILDQLESEAFEKIQNINLSSNLEEASAEISTYFFKGAEKIICDYGRKVANTPGDACVTPSGP